jgi:hypothetical protein
MTSASTDLAETVARDGFAVLAGVFAECQVVAICRSLEEAFASDGDAAIRSQAGAVYAARNLLAAWPEAHRVWRQPSLVAALAEILGPTYGLVRVLFFDKPPGRTWALPWHKDLTIAVRNNRLPSRAFARPTTKRGVPHVEAPREVLEAMLTARIHLDDVTEENGPLRAIPGSHCCGKELRLGEVPPRSILARQGDALLIRPLVAHCSNRSAADSPRHRRILHLEFAASPTLPDGFAWHTFLAG